MIDPVNLVNFFIAFFSAAMVIFMGAAYALFFAVAKIHRRILYEVCSYICYGFLGVSVYFMADALNLHGYWQIVV